MRKNKKRKFRRVFIGFVPGGCERKIKDTRHFQAGGSSSGPTRAPSLVEYRERSPHDWWW